MLLTPTIKYRHLKFHSSHSHIGIKNTYHHSSEVILLISKSIVSKIFLVQEKSGFILFISCFHSGDLLYDFTEFVALKT